MSLRPLSLGPLGGEGGGERARAASTGAFSPRRGHYRGLFTIVRNCNKNQVEEIVVETVIGSFFPISLERLSELLARDWGFRG